MTIRLDAGNLSQTRSDLGLAIGTDVLAPNGSAASLTAIPAAQITGTLPAVNGGSLTDLDANNLGSGTVPDARFPATLPAASAANLTSIPAGNLTGSVADARLPANLQSFPAPGSDGNVLTAASGAWTSAAAAGGGALELISSVASDNTSTSVTITGLTTAFKTYFLVGDSILWDNPSVGDQFHNTIQFGTSSGIVTTSTYGDQNIIQQLGGTSYNATSNNNVAQITLSAGNAPNRTSFALWLYSSQETLRPGLAGTVYGENTSGGSSQINNIYGGITSSGVDMNITQLKFACTNASATFNGGRISVYRLKHS